MPNQLNKNRNKPKEKDEIHTAQGILILTQQAERKRRFQKIADRHKSAEELFEETRQQVELVEEVREEFLNLYLPREENPDGRESTRTTWNAEGARMWSELFVHDTLLEQTDSLDGDPSSPKSTAARIQSVGVRIPSVIVEMIGPKEKLPKFDGDGAANPIQHCKTCKTIWRANGIMDTNDTLYEVWQLIGSPIQIPRS